MRSRPLPGSNLSISSPPNRLSAWSTWALAGLLAAGLGGEIHRLDAASPPVGRPVFQSIGLGENVIDGPVWAVASTSRGDLIIGSNRLWIRSGSRWSQIEIRDAYAFRALAPDQEGKRIWLGGVNALGYLETNAAGAWTYQSLLEKWQAEDVAKLGDVWEVSPTPQGAIWLTSDRVIRWDGSRFESWKRKGPSRLVGAPASDGLWFYDEPQGLLQIGPTGAPNLLASAASLPSAPLTWLLPPSAAEDTGMLGLADGVYRRQTDGSLIPLAALTRTLTDTLPGRATRLADGRIAIATFGHGVVLADAEGRTLEIIDRQHGLKNNTVYTLTSHDDQLWIGYQGGLVQIDGVGHTHLIDRQSGLRDGLPRGVRFTPEGQWLVTSEDVLFRRPAAHRFTTALGNESLLWSATRQNSVLWVGGFGGVWRSQGETMQKVYQTPTDVLLVSASRTLSDGILFFEGYRLKSLEPSPYGGWAAHDLGIIVEDTPLSLHESADGSVWITTMTHGILRCAWRSNGKERATLQVRPRYANPPALPENAGRARLVELGEHIFAFTDAGILRWEEDQRRFVVDPLFAAYQGIAATPGTSDLGAYWLVEPRSLAGRGPGALLRVATTDSGVTLEPIHGHGLNAIGAPTAVDQGENSLWVSGTEGVLKLDASELFSAPLPPALQLIPRAAGLATTTPPDRTSQLPADTRHLSFVFAPLASDHETVYVQTRLLGADQTWSEPSTETERDYAALAPGTYRFEARSIDPFGRPGPVAHFDFSLAAPWYRTLPAIIGYAIAGLLLVLLGARLRLRRLQQQNEQLNHLVAIRTRELALSNTAKSDFLENISHEIRNPLNGLSGLLALLKEDNLGPRERELTRSLRIVANNLLRVFGDVLSFSRLEYGYVTFDPQPFLLRPLLDEIVDFFSIQTRQPVVKIELNWPADLTDGFVGDHAKLRTIIENFTANALKYAPGSPIEIRVSTAPDSDAVTIAVADQGAGIPPEERALIFEKFVRGAETKRNRVAGTGLGLATCRALARLMQGEVSLSDTAVRGSTFCLNLPLPRTELALAPPAPFASKTKPTTKSCSKAWPSNSATRSMSPRRPNKRSTSSPPNPTKLSFWTGSCPTPRASKLHAPCAARKAPPTRSSSPRPLTTATRSGRNVGRPAWTSFCSNPTTPKPWPA